MEVSFVRSGPFENAVHASQPGSHEGRKPVLQMVKDKPKCDQSKRHTDKPCNNVAHPILLVCGIPGVFDARN
jgi:hypothetical protein